MDIQLLVTVIGWIGAFLFVLAYALLSLGFLKADTVIYHLLNMIGGILVGVNAFFNSAFPSFTINVVWIVIGVLALLRLNSMRRNV